MPSPLTALLIIKAHSVRVPNKNFRELAGKPLCRHILATLEQVSDITRVVIDTDARSQLAGAGVHDHVSAGDQRPVIIDREPALLGDEVTANALIASMLGRVDGEHFLMTHVTNPLLSADTIRSAIAAWWTALAAGTADSLMSVTRHQARFYDADGQPTNHEPARLLPTQQLPVLYEENSLLYLFTRTSFAETKSRVGVRPMFWPTPKIESVDIDTPQDWDVAAALLR